MIWDQAAGRVLGRVARVLDVPDHPDARHDVLLRLLHLAQDQDPATPSRKRKHSEHELKIELLKEHLYTMKLFR